MKLVCIKSYQGISEGKTYFGQITTYVGSLYFTVFDDRGVWTQYNLDLFEPRAE